MYEKDLKTYFAGLEEVVDINKQKRGLLIHALQAMQKEHNYLPETEIVKLSEELNISLTDIYSTASFYKSFHFKPRGKNIVCVCMGTACHVRGASKTLEKLERELSVNQGETSEDLSVTLETVGCVGCCGLAPVVTINEEVFGEIDPSKANLIVNKVRDNNNNPGG